MKVQFVDGKNVEIIFLLKVCNDTNCPHFFLNLRRLFYKYSVARTEQNALVKSTTNFFQILWPSQKTQALNISIKMRLHIGLGPIMADPILLLTYVFEQQ